MNKKFPKMAWSAFVVVLLLLSACNKTRDISSVAQPSGSSMTDILDRDVTLNVKTALMNDSVLNAFEIEVITTKGDVRLIGVVDTQSQIDTAIKLAKEAEGTRAIQDELTIKQ
ncbi:BON domain-containing protein [Paraglaciecola sp.]|uniref:BON domain-containing protein n=1 Tax=Paraglaciecola sp. TaxID=1920173 RepID=UPI0030F39CD4